MTVFVVLRAEEIQDVFASEELARAWCAATVERENQQTRTRHEEEVAKRKAWYARRPKGDRPGTVRLPPLADSAAWKDYGNPEWYTHMASIDDFEVWPWEVQE